MPKWFLPVIVAAIAGGMFFGSASPVVRPRAVAPVGRLAADYPAAPEAHAQAVSFSVPVSVRIPVIGLDTRILPVDLTPEGIVDVPPSDVGWYLRGPKPGETGSAVLDGHFIGADLAPGIFGNLSQVDVGDDVYSTDASGRTLRFRVTETELVETADFPVAKVYARDDIPRLNLVTCAGHYDPATGTYTRRTIVYARLEE